MRSHSPHMLYASSSHARNDTASMIVGVMILQPFVSKLRQSIDHFPNETNDCRKQDVLLFARECSPSHGVDRIQVCGFEITSIIPRKIRNFFLCVKTFLQLLPV
jgi:hypothetical protein